MPIMEEKKQYEAPEMEVIEILYEENCCQLNPTSGYQYGNDPFNP